MELIIANVFETLMGPSSEQNIKLFQRFVLFWGYVDRSKYENGINEYCGSYFKSCTDKIIQFIHQQFTEFHPSGAGRPQGIIPLVDDHREHHVKVNLDEVVRAL